MVEQLSPEAEQLLRFSKELRKNIEKDLLGLLGQLSIPTEKYNALIAYVHKAVLSAILLKAGAEKQQSEAL